MEMMSDFSHSETITNLCAKVESLLKVVPIANIRWPIVKKGVEDMQKAVNSASSSKPLEKSLIDRVASLFISLEDALQASKAIGGGTGSVGVAAKQASLLLSRLPLLKPSVISSSLLASIRSSSNSTPNPTSDDRNMGEFSEGDGNDSEYSSDSSYSSYSSSSEDEQSFSGSFSRNTASAADKWKKKDLTPSASASQTLASSIKKQPQRPQNIPKPDGTHAQAETEHHQMSCEELTPREALTPSEGLQRYTQILATRGRKSADKAIQIKELEAISSIVDLSVIDKIQIKLTLLSFYFERTASVSAAAWMNMLVAALSELIELGLGSKASLSSTSELKDISLSASSSSLFASLLASVQRLDDEYNNLLLTFPAPSSQGSSAMAAATMESSNHPLEYAELLRLERPLYLLLAKMQSLCAYFFDTKEEAREAIHDLTLRRLGHLYLKSDRGIKRMDTLESGDITLSAASESMAYRLLEMSGEPAVGICSTSGMSPVPAPLRLAAFLLLLQEDVAEVKRARTLLYLVSWIVGDGCPISVCSPFLLAKGLLVGSSLSESIIWADLHTQVLYNRTLALLGLAAFKEGRLKASMGLLGELIASGRCRELMGQAQGGFSAFEDPITASSRATTMMPWHTWIPTEPLEMVYLLSSVLVEIPNAILRGCVGGFQQQTSFPKPLRRLLSERTMAIQGAPDPGSGASSRDLIAGIARLILAGDWKHANALIAHLRLPVVSVGILSNIKRASLIAFFGKNASSWTSLDVSSFSEFFEMEVDEVLGLIKGWIFESTSNGVSSIVETPYLDADQKWVYAHKQFATADKSTDSAKTDKFAMWTSGLQLASTVSILSEKLSSLLQENEKFFHKRGSSSADSNSSFSQKHSATLKSKPAF